MNSYWQSAHIRLRAVEPGDAETLYRWNLDTERDRQLDFVWLPTSFESVQHWVTEQSRKKLEERKSPYGYKARFIGVTHGFRSYPCH